MDSGLAAASKEENGWDSNSEDWPLCRRCRGARTDAVLRLSEIEIRTGSQLPNAPTRHGNQATEFTDTNWKNRRGVGLRDLSRRCNKGQISTSMEANRGGFKAACRSGDRTRAMENRGTTYAQDLYKSKSEIVVSCLNGVRCINSSCTQRVQDSQNLSKSTVSAQRVANLDLQDSASERVMEMAPTPSGIAAPGSSSQVNRSSSRLPSMAEAPRNRHLHTQPILLCQNSIRWTSPNRPLGERRVSLGRCRRQKPTRASGR